MYSSLIEFYKQIHEFKQLNIADQILLIQCNLTHLIHIHHVLKDDFIENPFIARHMSQWINSNFHHQMSQTRHRYNYFIEYPNVLKLALIPLMFTINLSRLPLKQFSSKLMDQHLILKHQHFYITLLWKYLHVIYDENKALKAIEMIIFQYLRYQSLMNEMEQIISLQQQQQQTNLDQLCSLTKSLLRFN